ncbi:MAG: uracil-DNA glycosylase [bacterium]
MDELKKILSESIKDQQEIFGDDLFENLNSPVSKHNKEVNEEKFIVAERTEVEYGNNLFLENWQKAENANDLDKMINTCTRCNLGKTRTKFVFGSGNTNADIMLIGEAPGADEDLQGEAFVGRAGKLLNDILKAIELDRSKVFIANVLKCRPPNNRDPLPGEVETCIPYLHKQIELINPKIMLCLGRVAANELLSKKLTLGKLREDIYEFNGIKVMVTFHPAALLRNPNWKRDCWEDVKKFKKLYEELAGKL